jgi:hypothetical protein
MTARTLDAIHCELDYTEWNSKTLEHVAAIVTAAGYVIHSPDELDDSSDD